MSRKILMIIAIPVVLIVAAIVLAQLLLDEQKLLELAAKTLKEQTGATLVVDGEVKLSLFPRLGVDLSRTGITMPGEQSVSVNARSLSIGLGLLPLFSGSVEVDDILLDGVELVVQSAPEEPALDTTALSDEQLDAYYAKRREDQAAAGEVAGEEALLAVPLALNVQRLRVTDSVVETISADSAERSRIEIVKLEASDLNLDDRSIPLSLQVRIPGEEGAEPIEVAVDGKLRVNATSEQLTIETIAVAVNGVLTEEIKLEAKGVVDLARQVADLQLDLDLGAASGDGTLRYASYETPQIDTKLHLDNFDPALVVLAGPQAAAAASEGEGSSDESGDQPLPLNAVRAIDTRAALVIDAANFSGHVVENLRVKLRAVDGIVKVNSMTGKLHGGKLDMKATFNGQHNIARLNTQGGLTGLNLARALEAMESEPILSGKADLEWKLGGKGASSNDLIEALTGPIDLVTKKVTLKSVGVEKMLCRAVALANQKTMKATLPDSTKFDALSVHLKMKGGKLRMDPLRAELPNVKLAGEGAMDLLQQDFAATFTASLSPGLEELDPACKVNKRITGIGWPVECEGDLTGDPGDWCSVDSEQIIKDLATKEVKRKVEKEAGKYLDKLLKKKE